MSEIRECPFCGSVARKNSSDARMDLPADEQGTVHCSNRKCMAYNIPCMKPSKWNTRPTDKRIAELEAERAKLKEVLGIVFSIVCFSGEPSEVNIESNYSCGCSLCENSDGQGRPHDNDHQKRVEGLGIILDKALTAEEE